MLVMIRTRASMVVIHVDASESHDHDIIVIIHDSEDSFVLELRRRGDEPMGP